MKKYIILICLLFIITGCQKQSQIETTIENNDQVAIAINYPVTHIKEVDEKIKNHIKKTYDSFKNDYKTEEKKTELNIDYTYQQFSKKYLSISLKTFISSNKLAHPIHEIFTLVYDYQKKKIVSLQDIIDINNLKKQIPTIKQQLIKNYKNCLFLDLLNHRITTDYENYKLFTISNETLTLYFNPYEITAGYCDIIKINIPLEQLGMKIEAVVKEEINILTKKNNPIDVNKPSIALTFDDGPSKYTDKILKLLEKYQARATFFVIGNKIPIYENTIKTMYQNGNEIGNHSYSHKWLTRLSDEELQEQIEKTQELVQNITGHLPTLLRPTYGSINNRLRKSTNLEIIMWTMDTRDWEMKNGKKIAEKALSKIKNNDIILMHDNHQKTYEALKIMLPKLKEQGYQFLTVSELKQLKQITKQ